MSSRTAVAALLVGVAVLMAPCAASAQTSQRWRPDDRVLLTSFHLINSLTRDERRLYAATDHGLQILDLASGRWEMPSTMEDGYPRGEGPAGMTFDPLDRRLWLGTLRGDLYSYQVDLQRWEREGSPGVGPILRLTWFRDDDGEGLYARSPMGWFRVPSFSLLADPVPAGRLPGALRVLELPAEDRLARREPIFASARGAVLVDEAGQVWPMTDFAAGDRPGIFWISTAGDGLYAFDARFVTAEPRRFGLLTPSAGALASDGATIWFGGDGRGQRRGVTRGSFDLQEWRFHDVREGAPARRVDDVLPTSAAVWFAARDGVYRMDRASGRWRRAGGLAGSVTARRLARTSDGAVWAATDRGLARIVGGDGDDVAIAGGAIYAVAAVGDTLWAAGDGGVRRFLAGGEELEWPAGPDPPSARVVDLAVGDGVVWAVTAGALWRFEDDRWMGPLREVALSGAGRLGRARAVGRAVWVAGSGGAARWSPDTESWSYFLVGEDLPAGPVYDVLPAGDRVFVATLDGVLRLDWKKRF